MSAVASDTHERLRLTTQVTVIGVGSNLLLTVLKLLVGWIAQSQALVADGIHSLTDLVSDGLVLVATRQAHKAPDSSHPYGHGRIETAASLVLGFLLLVTALTIAAAAIGKLQSESAYVVPGVAALWVAGVSILSNEGLYHYTASVARRTQSSLLRANAWHHRTDSISSVVVLVGLAGSMMGVPILDPVAALAVAMMIAKVAWDVGWEAVRELTDTGLDRSRVKNIRSIIKGVSGVNGMHMLRSRKLGHRALVDVHVIVDPQISVSEGHRIADRIRDQVLRQHEDIEDVLVHVDSEDDESQAMGKFLPLRDQVERVVRAAIAAVPASELVEDLILHYERDQIHLEFRVPLSATENRQQAEEVISQLKQAVADLPHLGRVEVSFYT